MQFGLQQDLQRLENWSDKWLLRFNTAKWKVMHVGHSIKTKYFLHDNGLTTELEEVGEEKDLGVLVSISEDLKPSKQCVAAANKARSVLGVMYRHFTSLQSDQQTTVLDTVQDIRTPTLEVLHSSMVNKPPQRHRLYRECPEKSNKDGFWSKETELCAAPKEIEFDNSGGKTSEGI